MATCLHPKETFLDPEAASALLFRGFFANLFFSRHTPDSGSALLNSSCFPGPVMNYDFRWPSFLSWRLHSDGIAHQAISDFIIITTGRLSYLSSFGLAVSCLKIAKKKVLLFTLGTRTTIRFTMQKKKKITITSLAA